MQQSKTLKFLNTAAFYTLLGTIFLLPIFFLPAVFVPLAVSKGFLLAVGVTVSFLLWVAARLVDGNFEVPRHPLMWVVIVLPLIFLLSALVSPAPHVSLIGSGFDIGTVSTMILLSVALFLVSVFFQTKQHISKLYAGLLISFFVVSLFQIVHIFVNFEALFPQFFIQLGSQNLIGSWNDLGVYFGMMAILSLLSIEILPVRGWLRWLIYASLIISLFFLVAVNYYTAWVVVGIFALIIFVYTLSHLPQKRNRERTLPIASFLVVIVTLFFVLANSLVGGYVASKLGISNAEVRPSVETTVEIARSTVQTNPLLGVGPNRFGAQWLLEKPTAVNVTVFWDTIFGAGYGLVPTFFVTTGILGGLAWILFLVFLLVKGFEAVFATLKDPVSNYLLLSSFVAAIFLWVFAVVHVPNIFLFSLAFIMTGAFVGVLVDSGYISQHRFSFLDDPRNSFFSILLLVFLLIFTIVGGYAITKKFVARIQYTEGVRLASTAQDVASLTQAEQHLLRGVSTSEESIFYRALSDIYLARVGITLTNQELSEDEARLQLQSFVSQAEESALMAVRRDTTNYLNWIALAEVYQELIPLQVTDAYQNALAAYTEAEKKNPSSPAVPLRRAQVEVLNGDVDAAREHIVTALNRKPNYANAYFLLADIESEEGNESSAITILEQAASIMPNESAVFLRLGVLRYNAERYEGAVSAFERAAFLNPQSLNTRYFLGLAYYENGNRGQAEQQFELLAGALPENEEIQTIRENLRVGRAPLFGLTTSTQQSVEEAPIEEEATENGAGDVERTEDGTTVIPDDGE